jgi:Flp pilus assembly protein TadD
MRRYLCLAATLLLGACAHSAPDHPRAPVFADERFAAPSVKVDAQSVFALSPAMRRYLGEHIEPRVAFKGGSQGLIDALYTRGALKLDYDAATTRNAAEAFEARSGNCLSLVIMTAAFARELVIPVQFQSVVTDSDWTRDGDVYLSSGHVNLVLGQRLIDRRGVLPGNDDLLVDFLPSRELRGQRSRAITEETILAMYLNNRAVEHLARGRVADAYWWAKEAIVTSADFLSAYNTLGVVYLRSGHVDLAENSFRSVLEVEPANIAATANLAQVLRSAGRSADAAVYEQRLASLEPRPPYFYFDQGMAALKTGDLPGARNLFRREIERAAYHHEFHFWLGVTLYHLGDAAEARKHLDLARIYAPTKDDRALYAGKLAWIQAAASRQTPHKLP